MERYFATAMALFALFLSAGSQIGPLVAGYLTESNGWRWFFILCSILIAVNLVTTILFLPETTFRRAFFEGETAAELDKDVLGMAEHVEKPTLYETATNTQPDGVARPHYAGTYWKDLFQFRDRAQEAEGIRTWPRQFSLPFRFLLVPAVLFAACAYGIILGG
jgi:MFS family permease